MGLTATLIKKKCQYLYLKRIPNHPNLIVILSTEGNLISSSLLPRIAIWIKECSIKSGSTKTCTLQLKVSTKWPWLWLLKCHKTQSLKRKKITNKLKIPTQSPYKILCKKFKRKKKNVCLRREVYSRIGRKYRLLRNQNSRGWESYLKCRKKGSWWRSSLARSSLKIAETTYSYTRKSGMTLGLVASKLSSNITTFVTPMSHSRRWRN